MSGERAVRAGVVGWPPELAARYRAEGWWQGRTIADAVAGWAAERPDRVALVDGGRRLTYAALAQQVEAVAAGLAGLGLRGGPDGDVVLVQLPNTIELVVAILACARLNVPPVLALPAHRRHELAYLAEHGGARAIIVPDALRDFDHQALAAELRARVPALEHVVVSGEQVRPGHHDLGGFVAAGGRLTDPVDVAPGDVAMILLSGGTTGNPKLIPRTHDDYLYNARACAAACGWGPDTVYMAALPVAHNFALACPGVLGAFEVGGRVVLAASPEPQAAFAAIEREGVTDVAAVPAVLQRWMDEVTATPHDLSSLRRVQVGGARLAEQLARRVRPALSATLQQGFGMAEGLVNYTRPDDPEDVACRTQGRPVSPGDEIRIVDDADADVPAGEEGHLLTCGPYTIRGYFKAEQHNRVAFTADGWYRTGDVVRLDPSGNLIVEGRAKDQINRGGEKVAAEELENLLYALPQVARVAVVGAADPLLGERVAAAVVPAEGAALTLEGLREALASRGVARFKLPERLLLLDALPLTKVGKVDKALLRRRLAEPEPAA